jgi:hypothetical protein
MFVIVLAFAAGFTERLAQNAIERLVASERKEDTTENIASR